MTHLFCLCTLACACLCLELLCIYSNMVMVGHVCMCASTITCFCVWVAHACACKCLKFSVHVFICTHDIGKDMLRWCVCVCSNFTFLCNAVECVCAYTIMTRLFCVWWHLHGVCTCASMFEV